MKTIVINLFGAPGVGKSTGAAYIFALLKMAGIEAELVTEFAKDKVWEGNTAVFENQAYIFGKQSFRLSRCANKVDVIVTDSPLPLSIQYNQNDISRDNFNKYVLDIFNSYENKNYYLTRIKEYSGNGRFQTEDESNQIGKEIIKILNDNNIEYRYVNGDESNYRFIADEIIKLVKTRKE